MSFVYTIELVSGRLELVDRTHRPIPITGGTILEYFETDRRLSPGECSSLESWAYSKYQ